MSFLPTHSKLQSLRVTFLLSCFITLLVMYLKPPTSFFLGSVDLTAVTHQVKGLLSNNSKNNVTIILIWMWPFGQTFNLKACKIKDCCFTADRNLYNKSDGVIIHHRDLFGNFSNLPQLQRPPFQKWIWMNFEPPSNSLQIPGIENLFNLTLSYRRDADIVLPYGSIVAAESKEDFVPPSKNKLVCWIVSRWQKTFKRVAYFQEFQKHIKVHGFGKAFGKPISREDYMTTIASCKFYLSFENSIHMDYITEKFFNTLFLGTVPVVLGTPRQNYEDFIQGDAFIHVDDFTSPKELADYLLLLDKNEEIYLKYFKWRRHFHVKKDHSWAERTCLACDHLRKHRERKTVDVNKWYWGG